jgi:hypothetical protein
MEVQQSRHWHLQIAQRGLSPSDNTHFRLVTTFKPTTHDLRQAQQSMGFDYRGYGGPSGVDIVQTAVTKKYVTTWYCASSCD